VSVKRKNRFTIAVSGYPGAGSSTISKLLAKKLKYRYFSPGEYFKKIFGGKTSASALKGLKLKRGREKNLHFKIDEMQKRIARKKCAVICGKLSVFILKDLADFKIWIKAHRNVRAKRTAERDGIPYSKALKILRKREEIEKKLFKKIYNIDYEKLPLLADFILNNNKLTPEEAVETILKKIIPSRHR